jgi:hypothetical protein
LFGAAIRKESVMKRKHEAKNDFFYAFVMFAMFAVVVFNVAVEFFEYHPEAYFVDFNEAVEPSCDGRECRRACRCGSARGVKVMMTTRSPASA